VYARSLPSCAQRARKQSRICRAEGSDAGAMHRCPPGAASGSHAVGRCRRVAGTGCFWTPHLRRSPAIGWKLQLGGAKRETRGRATGRCTSIDSVSVLRHHGLRSARIPLTGSQAVTLCNAAGCLVPSFVAVPGTTLELWGPTTDLDRCRLDRVFPRKRLRPFGQVGERPNKFMAGRTRENGERDEARE